MKRALISVYDKTGIEEFARGLSACGVELIASGGTAAYLQERGIDATPVDELTDVPELLGGRVKTLHPRVHAAILARRDQPDDVATLQTHEIEPIDLVCVNLYPFSDAVGRRIVEAEAVELIDVGGPAILRAAAKNFAHVAAVCRPERYSAVAGELRERGEISYATRRALAAEAFATTAAYESAIASWFGEVETFPAVYVPAFEKVLDLRYGENPHQRAAYYSERGARRHLLSRVVQLHGPALSFNNLHDVNAATLLLQEFELPAAVLVKHANPCGVALAATIEDAFARAYACDPVSAYGMVLALNRPVTPRLGRELAEHFVDVVIAPGFDDAALEAMRAKRRTRILRDDERRAPTPGERDLKRVLGGLLVQDRDTRIEGRDGMDVVCGRVTEEQWGDVMFAWRVCKHVTSNAIVLAKGLSTIGIGAGQQSRVDAVRIALAKAQEHGHEVRGAALASDGLIPFADGPQLALEAGATTIIQPGGSKRDPEVVAAVETAGAAMVMTHRRHFRH